MEEKEEEIIVDSELTDDELKKRVSVSKSSKYNNNLKFAMKKALSQSIDEYEKNSLTIDGAVLTVADKISMKAVRYVLSEKENVTPLDVIDLEKSTGEYSEKQEVAVSNLSTIMETLKGDEY